MAKPSTKPASEVPQSTLFPKLKGWVKDSIEKHADWYSEAEECFGFVAGRGFSTDSKPAKGQWPGDSAQKMIESGRQPIEFNRIGPIVDSVCGLEVNNRQMIQAMPRRPGDGEVDERLTSLIEWARDEADAEDEESEMFRNGVICGRGWTETRIDFDEEPTGRIVVDCLDPLECGVDPASKKPCFVDARYVWRYRDVALDEAQAMFPGVPVSDLHAAWALRIQPEDGGPGNKTDYPEEQRPGFAPQLPPKQVRLVQIQWWERESRYLVASADADEPEDVSADDYAANQSDYEANGYKTQKVERRRYYQGILGRASVLDQTQKSCFTLRACTGRWDRNKGYHYGVVRPCRDPQMLANKTLSQVLHILNTNAKGGLIYERGAFANPRAAERDWANPQKNIEVAEGGLEKVRPREAPQMPVVLSSLQEFSISSIRDVTGVSVEMLGLADRDQPASLEYQRRQSAMTILASLFNALRHYRKLQGRTLIEQLKLLPPGVLVRVLINPKVAMAQFQSAYMQWQQQAMMAQQQGQQPPPPPQPPTAQFMKNTKVGEAFDPAAFGLDGDAEFGVIVDETPSSPNQKEATWATIQPFIPEMPLPLLPAVLKYSPLPDSAVQDLQEAIAQMGASGNAPEQQQNAQMMATIDDLKSKLAATQADKSAQQMTAAARQQEADTNRIRAITEIHQPSDLDALKGQIDVLSQAVSKIISHLGGQDNGTLG